MGNFDRSEHRIRGRIHLSSITDSYKKTIVLKKEKAPHQKWQSLVDPSMPNSIDLRGKFKRERLSHGSERTIALKIK